MILVQVCPPSLLDLAFVALLVTQAGVMFFFAIDENVRRFMTKALVRTFGWRAAAWCCGRRHRVAPAAATARAGQMTANCRPLSRIFGAELLSLGRSPTITVVPDPLPDTNQSQRDPGVGRAGEQGHGPRRSALVRTRSAQEDLNGLGWPTVRKNNSIIIIIGGCAILKK